MKYIHRIFSVLLILGMMMGFLSPAITQAKQASSPNLEIKTDKIELTLLDQFSTDGNADFIVRYVDQADLSPAYKMDWESRGWFVFNTLTESATKSQASSKSILDGLGLKYQTFITGNELYVWKGDLNAAQSLSALPEVELIRATRTFYIDPLVTDGNPLFSAKWAGDLLASNLNYDFSTDATVDWGITDTKADQFWTQYNVQGEGIVVANIDTGVQWNHPALVNQFKCAGDPGNPACWSDPSNICGGTACDNNGHGTHTMGTMVANDDPSLTYIAGMAPGAQWIACKGCESSSCSELALNSCADWIVAPNGNPDNRPNVVNNSWGGGGGDTWYLAKVQAWRAAGIFPAFSAGNNYSCSSMGSPGDYQESFASAAHASNRVIADFSSKGPSPFGDNPYTKPNISSPGVNICSSVPTDGWNCGYSGTSMASPHSAGAVALLWSCNPGLVGQIDQTFQILQNTANTPPAGTCGAPADGQGNFTYGYGYLDVLAAGLLNCGDVGNLEGYVTSNSQPVAGAVVTAVPALQNGSSIQAITDPNGFYHMTLQVGTYQVTAEHPQYITTVIPGVVITVDATTTLDISMDPKGLLFGYVTDNPNGFPLVGATVTADDGTTATTNNAGYYEMYLDPGSYVVTASMQDYAPQSLTVEIFSGVNTQLDFNLLAAISVVPDPIHGTVVLGGSGSVGTVATNNLTEDYPFEFVELQGGLLSGNNSINGSGGPDPFGYTYIDSNEPAGARYEWVDATDGTPLGLADDGEANVTLPFSFNFYGTTSTDIRVGNNGGVIFNATTGDFPITNGDLSTTTTNNIIVPFWDDIDADTGDVYYKVVGAAPYRQLIVEWYNRPHYSNVGNATFELILYETTNNIKYQYQDVVFGNVSYDYGASATAGIRQTSPNYLQYSYNQPVIQDNMAICFTFPGSAPCDGGDVLWFGESIPGGIVPGNGGTLGWTTLFTATTDTGIDQPGDYFATLRMQPATPGQPVKMVPVIMTVLPTLTQGQLEGTVTSDRPGGPLEGVDILVEGGGNTWNLTTDANGHYSYWFETGIYNVTASFAGYLTQTVTVIIPAGETITQDFLLILDASWIVVSPTSLEQTLELGQTADQTLNISNNGQEPLTFEIAERNGDFFPVTAGEDILVVQHDTSAATAMETALTTLGFSYLGVTDTQFQAMTVAQLLDYMAVFHAGITGYSGTPTASETLLMAYLDAGGSLFISDNDLGYYRHGSTFYDTYLQSTYDLDNAGDYADGLDLLAGLTLDLTADPYPDGITVGAEGVPILQYQGSSEQGGAALDRAGYRAVYTAFDYQNLATAEMKVEVINRILDFIAVMDVPWLTETPISGTIPVGDTAPINVNFNAGAVAEPGTYTAELRIKHNDPLTDRVIVPVTFTVIPGEGVGRLEGTITTMGYCDTNPAPLEADVLIEASDGSTWNVTSNADGFYYAWLPTGTYTVTASAPENLDASGTAVVLSQQTTVLDLSLRMVESCMDVTPTSFDISLPVDTQLTEPLTIINNGAGELLWEMHETTRTIGANSISVPRFTGTIPEDKAPLSLGRAPQSQTPTMSNGPQIPTAAPGYGMNLFDDSLYSIPDLAAPGVWNLVSAGPTSVYAGDFAADTDTIYMVSDDTRQLYAVDAATGATTTIGPCNPLAGQLWTGFAWDPTSQTMYGSATDGSTATLFTINLNTGAPTQVATISNAPYTIDIAIDASGQMYGVDLVLDSLLTIDKVTGATTVIGSIGFNANYAQGMDYDLDNGILYFAGYNGSTSTGGLYILDTSTGAAQLIATFSGGAEVDALAVKAGGIPPWNDVPWVTEVPTNGVVMADSAFDVDVTFDTTGLTPGECYTANLGIVHDDPGQDNPFFVPLNLCVTQPSYGVDLEPETSEGTGLPGDTITYILHLTNTGNIVDTFDLAYSNVEPGWQVSLPVTSVEVGAGETVDVTVLVTIPSGAANGDFDTFTVRATSTHDSNVFDDVEITTTVEIPIHNILLPIVIKN